MIAAEAVLVEQFYWVRYTFAAFLVVTRVKTLFAGGGEMDVANNPVVRCISRRIRVTPILHRQKCMIRVADAKTANMAFAATSLLLALIVINLADLVFAVD